MPRTLTALRLALAAGALLALTLAGRAQPFPGGKAVPTPLIVALVPYVGDEGVQKDLKLTDDQTKKLVAARQKMWDDAWNTAPKDVDVEARNKAVETAFKETLSGEQFKRASQLAAQLLWTNTPRGGFGPSGSAPPPPPAPDPRRVPAQVLALYPALADALMLDDTQKKLASGGLGRGGRFGTAVYLTPEQSDRAKEFLGEPVKGAPRPQFDTRNAFGFGGFGGGPGGGPGGGFGGRFGLPVSLQFTDAPDVQKELGLTEDQLRALVDVRLKWGQTGEDYFGLSPVGRKKVDDERLAELEKALGTALTAKQLKRLKEIERQQGPGPDVEFVTEGEVAKELAVTDAQRKKYEQIQTVYSDAVAKAVLSNEAPEKVRAAVAAANKDRTAAIDAILTPDQAAKKKELLGEPFTGNVFAGPGGGFNANQRKFTFGRYSNQLTTLTLFKGVQDELKLTPEQVKKLTDLMTEFNTKFTFQQLIQATQDEKTGDKHFAERAEFVAKALAEVLSKEQLARLRELELQRLEARAQTPGSQGGFNAFHTAAAYPGVAAAIKLTDEQRKKLIDGAKPADVLTEEQKKAIAGMLGKAAKLDVVFAPPNFPGVGGNLLPTVRPERQLLLNTAVWDAVKLDREQLTKLVPAANEYTLANPRRGGFPGGGGPGGPLIDPKEVKAAVDAFETAADGVLTADQKKRLDQLAVQQVLASGLDTALLSNRLPALTKALAPTDDQKKAVAALGAKFSALATELDRVDIAGDKEMDARRQLRDRLDAAVLMELTADQKAKLKELTGEPFAGFPKQPLFRGFGGFGGFGGDPFGP